VKSHFSFYLFNAWYCGFICLPLTTLSIVAMYETLQGDVKEGKEFYAFIIVIAMIGIAIISLCGFVINISAAIREHMKYDFDAESHAPAAKEVEQPS
jgi:preprotein translocase subunit Sss1